MMMKKTYWVSSLLWLLTAAANSIAGNIDDDLRNYLIENRNAFKGSNTLDYITIDDQYKRIKQSQEIDYNTIFLLINFLEQKYQDNYFCIIKDPQLFSLVFELCSNKKKFSRFGLDMLSYFDPQMVLHQSTAILEWFQNKEISIDLLYKLPKDILELAEFHSLKHEAIKRLDAEMSKNPKGERIYLTRQAKLGDPSAKAKLQSMLEQITFPDEKSFHKYRILIHDLLSLEDKDLNIVVVKQFSKNIGAPDYFSEFSVRYQIISGFYPQYCSDDFFIKYRPYMIYGRLYDSIPLDRYFFHDGDSIEEFFNEFQKWVKERLGYEMSLEGVDRKICLSHKFNVIPYPKNKSRSIIVQPLSDEQEKQILQTLLDEPQRYARSRTEQIAAWAEAQNLSDRQIADFVVKMLNDLFYQHKYQSVPGSERNSYARNSIFLLERFHPEKEKTKSILQDITRKDFFQCTRGPAVEVYVKLYSHQLVDDKYIDAVMMENEFDYHSKYTIMQSLFRSYSIASTVDEKIKIANKIIEWGFMESNIQLFYDVDQFLITHDKNYTTSEKRKIRLKKFIRYLDENGLSTKTPSYLHVQNALDHWDGKNVDEIQ